MLNIKFLIIFDLLLFYAGLLVFSAIHQTIDIEMVIAAFAASTILILLWHTLGFYNPKLPNNKYCFVLVSIIGYATFGLSIFVIDHKFPIEIISYEAAILISYFFLGLLVSRHFIQRMKNNGKASTKKKIALYGAGEAGKQTLKALELSAVFQNEILIDDNPDLQGKKILGHKVYSFEEACLLFEAKNICAVLLAMPSVNLKARQQLVEKISKQSIQVKTLPGLDELIDGKVEINEIKNFEIEDLLERKPSKPNEILLRKNIQGKTVLISGAGGSIGSEICRQVTELNPKKVLLLDISEKSAYEIQQDLIKRNPKCQKIIEIFVGSVADKQFVSEILKNNLPDTIYHAAAYKHVPLMEINKIQALKNNSFGTLILADEAIKHKVKSFTLISTDKAVYPTNIMGASKRFAELICQSRDRSQKFTKFSIVRFGNVLGSSGSVVPLFKSQILKGGPITVTDPNITRYFMTINEAATLVLQASSLATGGDIFVLDMGKPIKIIDLAIKMAALSGFKAIVNREKISKIEQQNVIDIQITGLRQGEKMYEELSHDSLLRNTIHKKIMRIEAEGLPEETINRLITQLKNKIQHNDLHGIQETLMLWADY